MDRVLSLTVFRRVAELRSFSAAARELGLSNGAVSKHVAALEDRVRARLLLRTTRRVSLTPAQGWGESDEVMFSGVMGFVGDSVRGTCLLAAPQGTVQAAAPKDAGARDWVGELANQLVGRLKAKLMARIGLSGGG